MVKVKMERDGVIPVVVRAGDAAYDVCSAEYMRIRVGETRTVCLGFSLALPTGKAALITGRSGLTTKGLQVLMGVVDSNYRGEVRAIVRNQTDSYYGINKGDRIAQMVIIDTYTEPLELVDNLDDTNRGTNGFGSSGLGALK